MASSAGTRVTLDDVARVAGVSKATASKVLNRRPDVAEATRVRVEAAIADLDYLPTTGPRDPLFDRNAHVVFDTLVNLYSVDILNGILAAGREFGVEVVVDVLQSAGGEVPLDLPWLQRATARNGLGVIVVTSRLSEKKIAAIKERGLGLVVIDPLDMPREDVPSVGSTNFAGGAQATRHLVELGHRRIAFIGGPATSGASQERLHGYRSVLELTGINVESDLISSGPFSYSAGLEVGLDLLSRPDRPTAVFCASDLIAVGVIEAARRLGTKVPEELSIVGYDDTYGAQLSTPPLTTVRQPITEIGRVALRTLLTLAHGGALDSHHIQLSTSLVVRDSAVAPSTAGSYGRP